MQRNQIQSPRIRLPRFVAFNGTEQRTKADLTRYLTMGKGETVLRDNVKKSNVKVVDHLIRLVRRDPVIARKVALCLLGSFGVSGSTLSNRVQLCITETSAECQENALEAKYAANLCDSADKAQLAEAISEHITALEALRDCVALDLYGRIPAASL
jgi:hypothetical protein